MSILEDNFDKLEGKLLIEAKGENEQRSYFTNKSLREIVGFHADKPRISSNAETSLTEEAMSLSSIRNNTSKLEKLTDNETEKQKAHSLKTPTYEPGLFYERMINDLKSDIAFLREQLLQKDSYFREKIKSLCNQVYSVYTKLLWREEVDFLSYGETVNLQNGKSNTLYLVSQEIHVTQKFQ